MKITKLQLLTASVLLALGGQGVHAAPINSFDFQTFGGFIDNENALCNDGASSCNLDFSNLESDVFGSDDAQYQDINWGTAATADGNRSGLRVQHQEGSIDTDGTSVLVDSFFHDNFVLTDAGGVDAKRGTLLPFRVVRSRRQLQPDFGSDLLANTDD